MSFNIREVFPYLIHYFFDEYLRKFYRWKLFYWNYLFTMKRLLRSFLIFSKKITVNGKYLLWNYICLHFLKIKLKQFSFITFSGNCYFNSFLLLLFEECKVFQLRKWRFDQWRTFRKHANWLFWFTLMKSSQACGNHIWFLKSVSLNENLWIF